jgi:hypothetical protein
MICISRFNNKVKRISVVTPATQTENCHFIPHSLRANNRIVHSLGHNCFLPNSFQFIISHFYYHATLYILTCWHRLYMGRKEICSTIVQKTVCLRGNFTLFRLISSFEVIRLFSFVLHERPRLKYRYQLQVDFATMRKGHLSLLPPGRAPWNWNAVSAFRLGRLLPSMFR